MKDPDWSECQSFEDRIIEIFIKKETELDEFKTYLRIFGRERLTEIWKKYQDLKRTK